MEWELVMALAAAIPIILLPAEFVGYLNIGGIYASTKEVHDKRATRERAIRTVAETK